MTKLTPSEVTFLATALANALAETLEDDELILFSNIFQMISDTLTTIASIRIIPIIQTQAQMQNQSKASREKQKREPN